MKKPKAARRKPRAGKDKPMFKALTKAIEAWTCELRLAREEGKRELATKCDLAEMEKRIIKAMGERVDPAEVGKLTKASDHLEQAVAANQPK